MNKILPVYIGRDVPLELKPLPNSWKARTVQHSMTASMNTTSTARVSTANINKSSLICSTWLVT